MAVGCPDLRPIDAGLRLARPNTWLPPTLPGSRRTKRRLLLRRPAVADAARPPASSLGDLTVRIPAISSSSSVPFDEHAQLVRVEHRSPDAIGRERWRRRS